MRSPNTAPILVGGALLSLALTSCGMFYSKVGERPGETDPGESGKVAITDVAVTEYEFGDEQTVAFNSPLSYSITVNTAPASADVAFGHEFSVVSKANQEQRLKGRVMFTPATNVATVVLNTKGIEIANESCVKKPSVLDTPKSEEQLSLSGLNEVAEYTCKLAGNWSAGKPYKVGIVNTEADGMMIKITGEGFEGDNGYLKLASLKNTELMSSLKAFTRALKAFGTCDLLPESNVSFGSPVLAGKAGQAVGGGNPIPACSDAITIQCTPAGCSHVINKGEISTP